MIRLDIPFVGFAPIIPVPLNGMSGGFGVSFWVPAKLYWTANAPDKVRLMSHRTVGIAFSAVL